MQTYFRLSLVSTENNVCEPEPGNDFCDVMTFVSPWPIRFHDKMKLECSWQRIPRAVVLGLLELNCNWLKIPTSEKSFPGSGSQTLFFGGDEREPEIRLLSQATDYSTCFCFNYRSAARLVDQIRLFKQMRYAFQTDDELKDRLKQRIHECKKENLHALASENASNFHLSSSHGSRKFHDAFKKMKATFGSHN